MCRCSCFFYCSCDHRDLHVLTHSFPTRRSSDLIAPVLKRGDVIILESTSPVGATEQMARWLAEQRSDLRFPANGEEWGEADVAIAHCPERVRSEEHTSELQSLMRISYAVFCLKKKNT